MKGKVIAVDFDGTCVTHERRKDSIPLGWNMKPF